MSDRPIDYAPHMLTPNERRVAEALLADPGRMAVLFPDGRAWPIVRAVLDAPYVGEPFAYAAYALTEPTQTYVVAAVAAGPRLVPNATRDGWVRADD